MRQLPFTSIIFAIVMAGYAVLRFADEFLANFWLSVGLGTGLFLVLARWISPATSLRRLWRDSPRLPRVASCIFLVIVLVFASLSGLGLVGAILVAPLLAAALLLNLALLMRGMPFLDKLAKRIREFFLPGSISNEAKSSEK